VTASDQEHQRASDGQAPARCAVLTVSDSRSLETDGSGSIVVERLESAGHVLVERDLLPDEPERIGTRLDTWFADPGIDVVLITGGTGFAPRDRTIEVLRERLDREIAGFGELFRMLSHRQVGAASMLSGALGGLVTRAPDRGAPTLVFAMPGSPKAVTLAMDELIVPQLKHLLWVVRG
jgi:molybdenum cofactor biosynthesis protein B